ncbi:hypothetical protein A6R68_03622 [Neotoma lepida]|uniref:UDP-glycosyltransferases domain-containing protein n=1 Tax=Neotoma lepida TaxID=56216 RepID=A0A1A6GNR3_NEOLE|nr:hypothetical protein A6R68_03622 [Neotoma lepida]
MSVKMTAALLLLQLSGFFESGSGGKVLVWPMEYSHWLNLRTMLDELVKRGHEVIVLRPSASLSYEVEDTSAIEFETYTTSYSVADVEELFMESIRKQIYEMTKKSFWRYFLMLQKVVWSYSDYFESLCKDVVLNKELMTKLHNSSFDVIVADPFIPCSDLLAEVFKIPLVYSLRFFPGSTYEKYSGGLPLPPSYVPPAMSELTDRMTFMERVQNVIYVLYFDFWFQTYNEKKWNQFYSEVLDELVKKGHEVTVLRPSASLSYEVEDTSAIEFETYSPSFSMADLEELYMESIRKYIYELPKQSFWRYFLMLQELLWKH